MLYCGDFGFCYVPLKNFDFFSFHLSLVTIHCFLTPVNKLCLLGCNSNLSSVPLFLAGVCPYTCVVPASARDWGKVYERMWILASLYICLLLEVPSLLFCHCLNSVFWSFNSCRAPDHSLHSIKKIRNGNSLTSSLLLSFIPHRICLLFTLQCLKGNF